MLLPRLLSVFNHRPQQGRKRHAMTQLVNQLKAAQAVTTERRLLRLQAVREATGLGRSSLYSLMRRGEFPSPIKLTERTVAWDSAAVAAWIHERVHAAV